MIPRLLTAVLLLALAGCATGTTHGSASPGPRVRCLANPHESGTRPLIFLFCAESP